MEINNFMKCYKSVKNVCPNPNDGTMQGMAYQKCLEIFPSIEVIQQGNVMDEEVPRHDLYNVETDQGISTEAVEKIDSLLSRTNKD